MEGHTEKRDLVNEHHHHPEHEEMELSLGLSMNGRFGVDPTMEKRLRRSSSSVPNLAAAVVGGVAERGVSDVPARAPEFDARASLWRTRSLPVTEADEEEERRRRKELRKKRMEKMRGLRVMRDKEISGGNGNSVLRRSENGDANHVMESSQRSGSSGSSDLIEGLKPKQTVEAPPSGQQISHEEPATGHRDAEVANIKSPKNPMLEMPLVTTKDTGPNGRKVEGFLYGFKKGEEVKIMCVCHGTFLTPKEFAEHGGGGAVEHPLKHIVVNPFPLV